MGENALDVLVREHEDIRQLFIRVRDPEADRVAAWLEVVKQVATHVAVERTFLYPLVKPRRLGTTPLSDQLRYDYARMEHLLVLTERRKVNSPDMPELATELLDVFEAHEKRCAADLIPTLRAHVDGSKLDQLGAKMTAAEKVILSHPHPHLLALGPVYRWTTRLASAWDATRDRTVRNR
jgi:hypothetical protein